MKCKAIINELADYLDEALDPTLRASIEQHLGNCKDCRIVVDTCQKTIQIFWNSSLLRSLKTRASACTKPY